MSKGIAAEGQASSPAGFQVVASLLDAVDRPLFVSDRSGQILFSNLHAQDALTASGLQAKPELNLFRDLLRADRKAVLGQLQAGKQEVDLPLEGLHGAFRARVRWLPEPDWLAVFVEESPAEPPADEAEMRHTVQELLQEREITYRNLLAAYLRLQEANRQKTVFLASAAHELKTPLAVMKGYYELLLSGSLGKLSEKQKDILRESKESCDRLVRLVSMFLNYSALESGKLVLQLHENDLRDCVNDMTVRWHDAFQPRRRPPGHPGRRGFAAVPIRLPESAAVHGEPDRQRAEAHAGGRPRHIGRSAPLLGAPPGRSIAYRRTPPLQRTPPE